MPKSPDPLKNRLLATLAEAERQRWFPQLESIDMPLGQVLYESGRTLSHVYFPTTSIVVSDGERCRGRDRSGGQ